MDEENPPSQEEKGVYDADILISRHDCPYNWWKMNKTRFPKLAILANKFLGVPSTSTPSERVFSSAGNIISAKRSCLAPKNVNNLIFLHQNSK